MDCKEIKISDNRETHTVADDLDTCEIYVFTDGVYKGDILIPTFSGDDAKCLHFGKEGIWQSGKRWYMQQGKLMKVTTKTRIRFDIDD